MTAPHPSLIGREHRHDPVVNAHVSSYQVDTLGLHTWDDLGAMIVADALADYVEKIIETADAVLAPDDHAEHIAWLRRLDNVHHDLRLIGAAEDDDAMERYREADDAYETRRAYYGERLLQSECV